MDVRRRAWMRLDLRRCWVITAILTTLSGCANRGVIESTQPLWPFEQLDLRISERDSISAYLSLPEGEAQRLIVVIQAPWCPLTGQPLADVSVSTSGVLREPFRVDSAFLQFERPAVRSTGNRGVVPTCKPEQTISVRQWTQGVEDAIDVIRTERKLKELPIVLIGVGSGIAPVLQLAHRVPRIAAIATLNGDWSHIDPAKLRLPRVRLVMIEAAHRSAVTLSISKAVFERTQTTRTADRIVAQDLSEDFGMSSGAVECFEQLAQLLSARLRTPADEPAQSIDWRCQKAPVDSRQ